jgi:hypothetical protein
MAKNDETPTPAPRPAAIFRLTARRLPPVVRTQGRVEAIAALNQRELVLLACYYIDLLLCAERSCHSGEPAYEPLSYDELPWPDTTTSSTMDMHNLQRLSELESILGSERVRSIYDLLAEHPDRPGISDFRLAGVIATGDGGAEDAWEFYEQLAAERAAAESAAERRFNLHLTCVEGIAAPLLWRP